MKAQQLSNISVTEYLTQEIASNTKYEYHNGQIYALAGGSMNHGLLCGNIYTEIRKSLSEKNKNRKAFNSEIKLHIESQNCYIYPDTMVACGDIKTSESLKDAVTNQEPPRITRLVPSLS